MPRKSETPMFDRLEELREAKRAAERRATELEAELRGSRRAVSRAKGPLLDYFRAIGAGEREPDPDLERELRAAVSDAESQVSTRPILRDGALVDLEVVNDETEAMLAGARERVEQADADLRDFASEHEAELIAERLPQSIAAHEAQVAAVRAFNDAETKRAREIRFYLDLGELTGTIDRGDLPPGPFEPVTGDESFAQLLYDFEQAVRRDPRAFLPAPRAAVESA
jgi:hypothetical protein